VYYLKEGSSSRERELEVAEFDGSSFGEQASDDSRYGGVRPYV
jgi:hypothetical protein